MTLCREAVGIVRCLRWRGRLADEVAWLWLVAETLARAPRLMVCTPVTRTAARGLELRSRTYRVVTISAMRRHVTRRRRQWAQRRRPGPDIDLRGSARLALGPGGGGAGSLSREHCDDQPEGRVFDTTAL